MLDYKPGLKLCLPALRVLTAATTLTLLQIIEGSRVLTHYEALDVHEGAGLDEIRSAFRTVKQRAGGLVSAEILEAFNVLTDLESRLLYDDVESKVRSELDDFGTVCNVGSDKGIVGSGASNKPQNLAHGKPTKQSSTRSGGGESSRAVDGVEDARWSGSSCTHTAPDGELEPWLSVDLGRDISIGQVRLLNRLEAHERLAHWQVRVGAAVDPRQGLACGVEEPGPAGPGAWVETSCAGLRGRYVGVVLGDGRRDAILTLCELQVFEHEARRGSCSHFERHIAAAQRYIEASHLVRTDSLYPRRATELIGAALERLDRHDVSRMEQLYRELNALQPGSLQATPTQLAVVLPELFLLRSRILERVALSSSCQGEKHCCVFSLSQTAVGCLSKALSFAKLAGRPGLERARALYEVSVSPVQQALEDIDPSPLAPWASFWQTCEFFYPVLRAGTSMHSPFWDPQDPGLNPMVTWLQRSRGVLQADLQRLLDADRHIESKPDSEFMPAHPALVEAGSLERLVLFDGQQGWNKKWCGTQAAAPLQLCRLLGQRLPGLSRGLAPYYLVDNHEEVTILRLLPWTRLRPHSDNTNARINIDMALQNAGTASLRIAGRTLRFGGASDGIIAYDACHDREVINDGKNPFYVLQVGVMHPSAIEMLTDKQSRGELDAKES